LEIFRRDPNDFLSRLVTMNEAWLYCYDPERKQQSMEWRQSGSPRPKKFRFQKSAGKVLASIFCDLNGILLIDYLPKDQTINTEYYSSLLVQLKDILKEKMPREIYQGDLVLATRKKVVYLGFHCLDHPPYSPVLALSDYHLFPGLKKQKKGDHFFPTRRSLLPRRTGWTDNFLNFF